MKFSDWHRYVAACFPRRAWAALLDCDLRRIGALLAVMRDEGLQRRKRNDDTGNYAVGVSDSALREWLALLERVGAGRLVWNDQAGAWELAAEAARACGAEALHCQGVRGLEICPKHNPACPHYRSPEYMQSFRSPQWRYLAPKKR